VHTRIAVLTLAIAAAGAAAQSPSPTKQWPTATPQKVGLNPAVLDSIDAEAKSGRYGYVDRILVIRHGNVAFDHSYAQDYDAAYKQAAVTESPLNGRDFAAPYNYYNPWWHPFYRRGDLHTLQSVTKTVTSVVIGIAVTRGVFPSLDTPVLSFFDSGSVANVDDRKRKMTVRNLMTMTAGFAWNGGLPYTDPNNTGSMLELSNDWVKYTMDRPMSDEPGTKYNYNSGATVVEAYIFRRATGIDIEEYAARYLFAPLGIEHWYWKRTPTGVADTEGGLYLEARDLAKIGYLYLHGGQWDGKQIVSADYVKASVSRAIAQNAGPNPTYHGLGWSLVPARRDATQSYWTHSGFGGQYLAAMPDDDMVVVLNAWNIGGPGIAQTRGLPSGQMLNRLAAAITDRRP